MKLTIRHLFASRPQYLFIELLSLGSHTQTQWPYRQMWPTHWSGLARARGLPIARPCLRQVLHPYKAAPKTAFSFIKRMRLVQRVKYFMFC